MPSNYTINVDVENRTVEFYMDGRRMDPYDFYVSSYIYKDCCEDEDERMAKRACVSITIGDEDNQQSLTQHFEVGNLSDPVSIYETRRSVLSGVSAAIEKTLSGLRQAFTLKEK